MKMLRNIFGPYRSQPFALNDDQVWFELNPYQPYDPDQDWLATRVDLWSDQGPYACLSVNLEERLKRPLATFYGTPGWSRAFLIQLESQGWLVPVTGRDAETGQEDDIFPPLQVGRYEHRARVYVLTDQAQSLFKSPLPRHWPAFSGVTK
jgi:hypothetical protein